MHIFEHVDRDDRWYDRVAADRGGDLIVGSIEAQFASARTIPRSFPAQIMGELPTDLTFYVSTRNCGVLRYDRGVLTQLISGYTFGITCIPSDAAAAQGPLFLAYQGTGLHGRLVLVSEAGRQQSAAVRVRPLVWGLSRGVHQIRLDQPGWLGADGLTLLAADTYRNRLLRFSWAELTTHRKRAGIGMRRAVRQAAYPAGRLKNGQRSENYRHFNSLFPAHDGTWWVMAHNDTHKTGRGSLIFHLNADLEVIDAVDIKGSDCHDIVIDSLGRFLFCDSRRGSLVVAGQPVLRVPGFTRGLAVGPDRILLGASPIATRGERSSSEGSVVHVLDADFLPMGRISVPGGQIHDLSLLPGSSTTD